MPRVAEEHKIGELVQRFLRHDGGVLRQSRHALNRLRIPRDLAVAHHAFGRGGKTGPLARSRLLVAVRTLQLQRRMPLVTERNRLAGDCRYGKV